MYKGWVKKEYPKECPKCSILGKSLEDALGAGEIHDEESGKERCGWEMLLWEIGR